MMRKLADISGFIFDLDGTVYLGEVALPGAVETMVALCQRQKQIVYVSNKPLEGEEAYAAKLTRLGIPTTPEQVITSAFVLAHHLARTQPTLRLYVVGEDHLKAELRNHGLIVVEAPSQDPKQVIDAEGIDAVVVSFDRTLDYGKLNTAYQALTRGARFFATNSDKVCPMPNGAIPDAGAIIAALEHISGRKVELLAGKPSRLITQAALERLGLPAEKCLMVGDRLETDIRMGKEAGMYTAVVLSGVSSHADVARSEVQPDFVLEDLSALLNLLA